MQLVQTCANYCKHLQTNNCQAIYEDLWSPCFPTTPQIPPKLTSIRRQNANLPNPEQGTYLRWTLWDIGTNKLHGGAKHKSAWSRNLDFMFTKQNPLATMINYEQNVGPTRLWIEHIFEKNVNQNNGCRMVFTGVNKKYRKLYETVGEHQNQIKSGVETLFCQYVLTRVCEDVKGCSLQLMTPKCSCNPLACTEHIRTTQKLATLPFLAIGRECVPVLGWVKPLPFIDRCGHINMPTPSSTDECKHDALDAMPHVLAKSTEVQKRSKELVSS